jgi:hypothetical protein
MLLLSKADTPAAAGGGAVDVLGRGVDEVLMYCLSGTVTVCTTCSDAAAAAAAGCGGGLPAVAVAAAADDDEVDEVDDGPASCCL